MGKRAVYKTQPRNIVANTDLRMDNQSILTGRLAVIDRMGRHNERVRNGHHLILRSTDAGDEQCFLNDVARSIVQLDAVTQLERPHVGYDQSCNDIADNRTGTERNNQADKHGDSLEDSRLGTRQIRENHGNHKRIKQEAHNMIGRNGPIRIEAVYLQPFSLHLIGKIMHQSDQVLHRIAYHKDSEQIGYIVGYSIQDDLYRIPDVGE